MITTEKTFILDKPYILLPLEEYNKLIGKWITKSSLSLKQQAYVNFYEKYYLENWTYPTYDIAEKHFKKHRSTIHSTIQRIKKKWYIFSSL